MAYKKPKDGFDAAKAREEAKAAKYAEMDRGLVEVKGGLVKNRVYRDVPEDAGQAVVGRIKGRQLEALKASLAKRYGGNNG